MPESAGATLAGAFTWLDWAVVAGLFALTHFIGQAAAGKPATIREFFLGGRKLPWLAVSASIVSTEISAVSLVAVPAMVFAKGGNLTYLQLGVIGLFLARWIVALALIPRYFEREIYSPYDYMGAQLGERVRGMTTVLFGVGGVLGQSARLYVTAVVLEIVLHEEFASFEAATGVSGLGASIVVLGAVAVLWTWLGGMTMVIWTDVVLTLVFLIAIGVAIAVAVDGVSGGAGEVLRLGREAGKLEFLDASLDFSRPYTLWAAIVANTFVGVGVFGTDQLMTQRVFCCRNVRDAQKAMIVSYSSMIIAVLCAVIGLALYGYYQQHPLSDAASELVAAKQDRIFPIFIVQELPEGVRGLAIAGLFAAAIGGLDSILAALSQTTLSAFWFPWLRRRGHASPEEDPRALRWSKVLVLVFGVLLCAIAWQCETIQADPRFRSILDLALAMPGYTQGALLAAFALAFFFRGRIDGDGYLWSAPLSVLAVMVVAWNASWVPWVLAPASAVLLATWLAARSTRRHTRASFASRLAILLVGLAGLWALRGISGTVAWPWFAPIGCATAFVFGYLLASPRTENAA